MKVRSNFSIKFIATKTQNRNPLPQYPHRFRNLLLSSDIHVKISWHLKFFNCDIERIIHGCQRLWEAGRGMCDCYDDGLEVHHALSLFHIWSQHFCLCTASLYQLTCFIHNPLTAKDFIWNRIKFVLSFVGWQKIMIFKIIKFFILYLVIERLNQVHAKSALTKRIIWISMKLIID